MKKKENNKHILIIQACETCFECKQTLYVVIDFNKMSAIYLNIWSLSILIAKLVAAPIPQTIIFKYEFF